MHTTKGGIIFPQYGSKFLTHYYTYPANTVAAANRLAADTMHVHP